MSLFVDSSAFYAAADSGDQSHARAVAILRGGDELLTSDHVLVESWLLMRSRGDRAAADRFWGGIRRGLHWAKTTVVASAFTGFLSFFLFLGFGYFDPLHAFVTAILFQFALMERLGLSSVASFDDDFAIYRYGARRSRAFDVRH